MSQQPLNLRRSIQIVRDTSCFSVPLLLLACSSVPRTPYSSRLRSRVRHLLHSHKLLRMLRSRPR